MIDILKKYKEFNITSPISSRKIVFSDNFEDQEFDGFYEKDGRLVLTKDKNIIAKLSYSNGEFMGPDSRGGVTRIYTDPRFREAFKQEFIVTRQEKVNYNDTNYKSGEQTLVISELNEYKEIFPNFNVIKPKNNRLFDIYDGAFSSGTGLILNMNCPGNDQSAPLLVNMSNALIKDKVGSVQLFSSKTGTDPSLMTLETGEWKGFALTSDVWAKIRVKMSNRNYNFYRNLTLQFREKGLIRLSPELPRQVSLTARDGMRKVFSVLLD